MLLDLVQLTHLNQEKNLTMRPSTKQPFHSFIALITVSVLVVGCGKAPAAPQVQAGSGMPLTPTSMAVAPAGGDTPTAPPSPLASPLQTPPTQNPGWQTFSHHNGVSLEYPAGWDVVRDGRPAESDEFFLMIRPPDGFHVQVIVTASIIPSEQVSGLLYTYAGDVNNNPMRMIKTVWDRQLTNRNGLDWHLTIQGGPRFGGMFNGIDYIAQAGGLTEGTIEAIHYDATRELAILISKELDRDMLITLHESGPDAIYPALVPVFEEMLQSVAVQNASPPTATQTPAGDTPTAPPSPLASPLQTPPTQKPGSQTFTHHNGVSFHYPAGWQIVRDGTPEESIEFRLRVRPPGDAFFFEQIQVVATTVPGEEVSNLYSYTGDVITSQQFGDRKTVWDKQVSNSNRVDWHLTIRGISSYAVNIDGVEYIGQEGGLTEARLQAVHYDPTTKLAITLSKDLDRDLLIALHESGPDAVYPALVAVFEEILQSVTIQGR